MLAFAVVLLGFTACQKSTKDQLVGTWHCVKNITFDGVKGRMEVTQTNNEDETFSFVANITFDTEIEGDSVRIKAVANYKCSGDWTVNDKEIVSNPTSVETKVTSIKFYDLSNGSFLTELTGNELKEASNDFADKMRETCLEVVSTERILILQENKYVTEYTDDDGNKKTFTYNRLK